MPAVQYPFIDIAVHARVRDGFARGEAIVLFSLDMQHVLWASSTGARLFGNPAIYDFLEEGPNTSDVTFRQVEAMARQLKRDGERRALTVRIAQGFRRLGVEGSVERIVTPAGEPAILFSVPLRASPLPLSERARQMLEGFDDDDTHMAVLDGQGAVIAASKGFSTLGVTDHTARMLVTMVGHDPDRLMKRPIPTERGYLPAAIGRVCDEPGLNLLFVVEMAIGNLDPSEDFAPASPVPSSTDAVEHAVAEPDLLDAIGDIVAIDDETDLVDAPIPQDTAGDDAVAADAVTGTVVSSEDEKPARDTTSIEAAPDAEQPVKIEPALPAASAPVPGGFVFDPMARAIRFVWKIDAEGRFSDISGEFAKAVGPHAAAVRGLVFGDVAHLFQLDPDGTIVELLGKRDTWSGKTIHWPVEGTTLRVPVDLAALPTYTRNREFDGFRGFGIVRPADAVPDSYELGLTLVDAAPMVAASEPVADDAASGETTPSEPTKDAAASDTPQAAVNDASDSPAPAAPEVPEEQSFLRMPWGEIPALKITEAPDHSQSDKVVVLEDRRGRGEALTAGEQAAFREIARRLETLTRPAQEGDAAPPETAASEELAASAEDSVSPEETGAAEAETKDAAEALSAGQDAVGADEDGDGLSGLLPPRSQMHQPLTPADIDAMPVAMLVHAGDRLMYANAAFLSLTGYQTLADLVAVGGLDALLQRDDLSHAAGSLTLLRENDDLVRVTARLQSVHWQDGNALLLALMPVDAPQRQSAVETETLAEEMPVPPVPEEDASSEIPPHADEAMPAPSENEIEALPEAEVTDETSDADAGVSADEVARLRGEVEELRSILETATDGVVILDSDHTIRSMNRSASALFNYDNSETFDKPFVMLFAHESQKSVLDYLQALSGHGVASVLNDGREVIGREASGGFIPLFMTMGRLTASDGYCAVIRDITQWKRTEDELRNAKRAAETANAHKSDFLARVSHEIRTPLNAIIGFSDMMATERFGTIGHPRYIEYANDIGRSGRHVLDIVNDLLDISKIEAGEMDLDFTTVGLNETVAEAVALVQPQANGQRVIIRTALSASVPNVVADLRSIKQIALNMLSNAIRFTPSGGQIVVSTSYEVNGSVVLRIRDTGVGMTRSELEQAMKPFRQVTTGTRKRGDGTGLGLPLTKAMVDANRAQFSISSSPNEGTLVEITFPSPRVVAQ